MQSTDIDGIIIPSADPVFLGVVAIHVGLGLVCVLSGIGAMLAAKGPGRHARFGTLYFYGMAGLFSTMAFLAAERWREDYHLFVLGALAFALVVVARQAARRGNLRTHMLCMGSSYIVMLTAFYVDNGKNLPVWRSLPEIAYWTVPALIGVPVILWAFRRHPLLRSRSQP